MTDHSQNGWPVVVRADIATFVVPGTTVKLPILPGDVATVLIYVADEFNKTVERLTIPGCWGYAARTIRGSSTTISNHASGTAIDLNAPQHPLAARGTFTAKQVAAIDAILAFCDGVVRWGGHYTSRKDEMHFEINAGKAAVAALARKIRVAREAKAPTKSISFVLVPGTSHHRSVILLQKTLNAVAKSRLTADGDFGPKTTAAVQSFKLHSPSPALRADHRNPAVGPLTCKALGIKWTG
jgi:D-alanyl-D-alanine carboxypeptidase